MSFAGGGADGGVRFQKTNGVGVITLDRPATKNALDQAMRSALHELLQALRQDSSVSVLVINGANGNFCSGGDLRELQASAVGPQGDAAGRRQRMIDLHPVVEMLVHFDRPVISAVQGVSYGGGLGLALTADLVLAADDARFCAAFGRIGAVPDVGTFYTLPRLVGVQRAKELVFSAREFGAAEAQRLGLVLETHAPDRLMERAMGLAAALSRASPVALSVAKRALNVSLQHDLRSMLLLEADGQGVALATEYHAAAVCRVLAKQPPLLDWPSR